VETSGFGPPFELPDASATRMWRDVRSLGGLDCWCREHGLSLFRWVFPRFHHDPGLEAWKREQADAAV
jgi:hypothetical protein